MTIAGDSCEYNLLTKWSKDFDCQGFSTCEIGVRAGLGSKIIMDNCKNSLIHIGIDPYGNLKYQHYDNESPYTSDYTDEMRDKLLEDMAQYGSKFQLANMKDYEFMAQPEYNTTYAFVHFDGPHKTENVLTESIWFANHIPNKARFVFDDYPKYNMQLVRDCLKPFGFEILESGDNKICLEKK